MLKLLGKEIIITVKSVAFLLCIIAIVAMFLTQCFPEKWYWYAYPMDEMHFFYVKLRILAASKPCNDAVLVNANIEDSYVKLMNMS